MNTIFKSKYFPLFWTGAGGVTIGENVYIRKDMWDTMEEPARAAMLAHEAVHVRQEAETGLLKFLFRYITSKSYRFQVEIEAFAAETKYWIDNGVEKNAAIAIVALSFSSKLYKVASYSEAVISLREALK